MDGMKSSLIINTGPTVQDRDEVTINRKHMWASTTNQAQKWE